ncbi:MAG: hypothetical protein WCF67_13645, partial [Chitinophagaceae bacterium]
DNGSRFDEQVQKTALYFYDPLWLHWQLKGLKHENGQPDDVKPVQPLAVIPEIPVVADNSEEPGPIEEPEVFEEPEAPLEQEVHSDELPVLTEPESMPLEEAQPEEIPAPVETTQADEEQAVEQETPETIENFHTETTEPPEPEVVEPVEEVAEPVQPEIMAVSEQPAPTVIPNPKPAVREAPLAFDPYYTIDYFASQGIKPPADVQPGDKLGKQLKSFTEWLKTMKRLPHTVPEPRNDEAEQQNIRRFAAGSLEEKEVVTETMAEVLIKQDRRGEAIDIYEKLSLLDPSKRAYFAAKIENLKAN